MATKKFEWNLKQDNKLTLSCTDAELWNLFTNILACGTYGCTYKLKAGNPDVQKAYGLQGLDMKHVVLKMIYQDEEVEEAKSSKSELDKQIARLRNDMKLSTVSELRIQNYMATKGLAAELYTFDVALTCDEVAIVKEKDAQGKPVETRVARTATGYLQQKLFATVLEVSQFCGRSYDNKSNADLNARYGIKTENADQKARLEAFVARNKKAAPLTLILGTLAKASKLIQEIHKLGYLHMDFRWHLGNLMVDTEALGNVLAIDFGLAEYFGEDVAKTLEEIGVVPTDGNRVPLHMGDATLSENIWYEEIVKQRVSGLPLASDTAIETPRSLNLAEIEPDMREIYLKEFKLSEKEVNELFNTERMVQATMLQSMIQFFNFYYSEERLNAYLAWITTMWSIFEPFVDLVDTNASEEALLGALSVLFDALPFRQQEKPDLIAKFKLGLPAINVPAACTHSARLEAHWETLLFVLRAMARNADPNERVMSEIILMVAGEHSSMQQLFTNNPAAFKELVKSLFPGNSLRKLPYREMFAEAYLTYNVFFRYLSNKNKAK